MARSSARLCVCLIVLGLLAAHAPAPRAMTVKQVDLGEMCRMAHLIFRGKVIGITSGGVQVGGGTVPTLTYRLIVQEIFKGSFARLKGKAYVDLKMIGKIMSPATRGGAVHNISLPLMPHLTVGGEVLLFTTRPGGPGLSATVGLGQGCFHIHGEPGREEAVNEFGNLGLLAGGPSASGSRTPLTYLQLAAEIRARLAAP
ncbi:MAG: hypothetical protein ACE5ID_02960 [Acidobacteriota bacterium]